MGRRSRFRPGSSDNEVRSFPQGGIHSKNPVSVKGRLRTELARCHKVGPTAEMQAHKAKMQGNEAQEAKTQGNEEPQGQNARK